jgi:hypothetical protein
MRRTGLLTALQTVVPSFMVVDCDAAAVAGGVATIAAPIPAGLAGDRVRLVPMSNNTASTYTASGASSVHAQAAIGCALLEYTDATTGGGTLTVNRNTSTTAGCIVVVIRTRYGGTIADTEFVSASGDPTAPSVDAAANSSILISVATRLVSLAGQSWTIPSGMSPVDSGDTTGSVFAWSVASLVVNTGATGSKAWDQSGTGATRAVNFVVNPV